MKVFWSRVPAWLRPGMTGTIVFIVLIALQACLGESSGSGTVGPAGVYETTSSRSIGWPASVIITSKSGDGAKSNEVAVHWTPLLIMGGLTYCLAMAVGHLASRKRRKRRPAIILVNVILGTSVLAFLAAILVSKAMWGYYLFRPSLDRRIFDAGKVLSVTIVKTASGESGRTLVPDTSFSITQRIQYGRDDVYYRLGERALIALQDQGRLPTDPPAMNADRLARLYGVLSRTGRIEAGESGYQDAEDLRGVVIEAEGADKKSLLFVGVQGGQVSNDHYPYYEFLFSDAGDLKDSKLLSTQRFYFDVAGIEGMEWPVFFIGFSALGIVFTVSTTLLLLVFWPTPKVSEIGKADPNLRDNQGSETPSPPPGAGS
jgi:hypothetical protein